MSGRISLDRIAAAADVIDPVFLRSPQFVSEPLSDALGVRTVVKVETVNPIRCFKGRGADYYLSTLEGTDPRPEIVCASAGNFGQAMAFAARRRGFALTVYASEAANALKVERMRALGATVVLHGEDFDAAKDEAKRFAAESGALMVQDSLEAAITEGTGTIGVELMACPEPLDAVIVPLGNGAMIVGIARWVKSVSPRTQVIAVSAAGAPAMVRSWLAARAIETDRADTIADGIAVRVPVPEAVADLQGLVDDAILVGDDALVAQMRAAHRHLGLVLEPAGAAGLAGVAAVADRLAGQTVATVLCGGNLTPEQAARWLKGQSE